ncbi:flavodoxin-dependent (E)-4-hydroxy-3-methylbut-2-enyl-diphosphate synthase [Leifsonia sp. PS1209]|uniref:flavodoxin-dependent (E)-4-hydroxy-3-methylbut-2-enyl-diphosphate synthase n=1 Tax=Leifsonia sp. PS1209 TaxID=2724914 RepID=UPI001442BA12|nr:flavodoxin-dependent (E)-4-hydroxy-3-methylbut-2-enyl-diphosphate synthase [Leifsonia sp. PS1209]QIZ97831.1 flavodoxin-dependent (E)-4-hydroxy-3-methylbut-2-enyl-diphosphate synthase [Leifsonia sp. PS1209]
MTGENAPSEGEQSSLSEAAAPASGVVAETAAPPEKAPPLGKWLWVLPPVLTALLAFGVAIWGPGFGAGAIAALGAWIVWAIAREAGTRRAPVFALALGAAAGVLLFLLCTQQSAHVFGSPAPAVASHAATPTPTPTPTSTQGASAITCSAEIERSASDASTVSVTGSVAQLPDAAKATTVATSDGRVLATEDSYPDDKGVATIRLSLTSAPGEAVQIRTEVRVGAQILQSCGW